METRILAEHDRVDALHFPPELEILRSDFEVASMLDAQEIIFNAATLQLRNDLNLWLNSH